MRAGLAIGAMPGACLAELACELVAAATWQALDLAAGGAAAGPAAGPRRAGYEGKGRAGFARYGPETGRHGTAWRRPAPAIRAARYRGGQPARKAAGRQ